MSRDRTTSARRRIYAVGLADSTGLGMYLAFSAVYLNQAVRMPNDQIGLVLGITGITSLLGALPIARFAQRHGLRRALWWLFLARAASYVALACAVNLPTAALAAGFGGLLNRGIGPLVQSVLITGTDSAGAVAGLARLRALRNAGMAAGALPSGAAVAIGQQWAYRGVMLAAAAVFVGCAVISRGFSDSGEVKRPAARRGAGVGRDRVFLLITASYGALTLSAILLGVGLPLWITQRTHAPSWSVGLVQILNTVLVVLLQVRVSRGSQDPRRARAMMLAGGLLAAAGALAAPLTGFGRGALPLAAVVLTVLLMTGAELYITSGGLSLALAHTPQERRPVYLATFNLGFAAATVVGPTLVSLGLGLGRPGWFAWALLFALLGLACLALPTAPRLRGAERTAEQSAVSA
ncbi:MFS transporter [Streptomyces sp. RPT161]|uniref:MFS transporter n=1 Tax=Streptomyces sp. RPT161 TaxID=3015993 RepID=UPI0022B8A193|nr:MFS transporter [Streptomyces sp. RPT161]